MDNYEVIIIGYNLAALATAALLAKSNCRVLLLNDRAATENEKFRRAELGFDVLFYSWDYATGAMKFVLEKLEIGELGGAEGGGYIDTVISPQGRLCRPLGWDAYRDTLVPAYPREKEKLHFFFAELKDLGDEWICFLRSGSLTDLAKLKKTIKYRNLTYSRFVESLFDEGEIRRILLADLPQAGVTLPVMAGYLVTQVFDYHYIPGGYGRVCQLLQHALEEVGGSISAVDEPLSVHPETNGGFIIETKGQTFKGEKVVSTLDPLQTILRYFPGSSPGQSWAALKGDRPPVLTALFLILTMDQDFDSENLFPGAVLHKVSTARTDEYLASVERGQDFGQSFRVYKEQQRNRLILQADLPWKKRDHNEYIMLSKELKAAFSGIFPYENWIKTEAIVTPDELERMTGYTKGSFRSWAFRPGESETNPFEQRLPTKGLFTTGQWGSAWFTAAVAAWRSVLKNNTTGVKKDDLRQGN